MTACCPSCTIKNTVPGQINSTTATITPTPGATPTITPTPGPTDTPTVTPIPTVVPGTRGDCNNDGAVNAADITSCVLEIFDGDGNSWLDTPGGSFAGNPMGCDSNQDQRVDAGDIVCKTLIIFQGPAACNAAAKFLTAPAAQLALPAVPAEAGATVALPITLTTNGHSLAAAVFSLNLPADLHFDATDADEDGIPDAVQFNVAGGFTKSAQYDAAQHRVDIWIADLALPLNTLPDGPLATVMVEVAADAATDQMLDVRFGDAPPASLGSPDGAAAAVATDDGAVILGSPAQLDHKLYLPVTTK